MASSMAFFTIFSLLLVGNAVGGRKEPGENWRDAARKLGVIVKDSEHKQEKVFWVYDDGDAKLTEEKSFVKDFEPRPNSSPYHDDDDGVSTKEEKEKPFVVDFEPILNLSVYSE